MRLVHPNEGYTGKVDLSMFTFIIVLIAFIAIFITLAVLVQSGRGGGLAGIASGGATQQILGTRQAPDVLEKSTWTLATAFIVLCILSNFAIGGEEVPESVIQQRGLEEQVAPGIPPVGQQQQLPILPDPGDASSDSEGEEGSGEGDGTEE